MKHEVGIWIDHREAIIARLSSTDSGKNVHDISSGVDSHPRFSGGAASATEEDIRDRKHGNHLNAFYDSVIKSIHAADAILIMGPGEAKVELNKRLEGQHLGHKIVAVITADKMTQNQVHARVRKYFEERPTKLI